MLLKLEYCIKISPHKRFVFISDAEAIRNLLWQLTHNYNSHDGTAIGELTVSNLDGVVINCEEILASPFRWATNLSTGTE